MKNMKPNKNISFIDVSMDLGAASPVEHDIMKEAKRNKFVMNESELRNYIYEKVLKVLNEDAPMDPAALVPPAGGAPMPGADPMVGGAMPGAMPPADDADRANLPGAAKTAKEKADKFKDQNGGAKGFSPQEDKEDDDDKKKDKDDK